LRDRISPAPEVINEMITSIQPQPGLESSAVVSQPRYILQDSSPLHGIRAYALRRVLRIPERIRQNDCDNKTVGTPRLARGDKLHHKFAVIDNKTVITGSFNWSPSAAHTNDETLLVIHSPKLAAHFTREMNRMWRSAELGVTPRIQSKLHRQQTKCGSGVERVE